MFKKTIVIVAMLLTTSAAPAFAHGIGAEMSAGNGQSASAISCWGFIPFDDRLPDGAVVAGAGLLWRPCVGL